MLDNPLKLAKEALDKAIETERRNKAFLASIGPAIVETIKDSLSPFLKGVQTEIKDAFKNIKVDVNPRIEVNPEVKIPDIIVPDITIPEIQVPEAHITVDIPPIKIPDIVMPDEMNVRGWLSLIDWDRKLLNNPIPVQLRDSKGNPLALFENLTQIISSGGGGKMDYLTIKGFSASAYADYLNADNRLRVSVETGGGGLTDTELRAIAVPVSQVSGAIWSVSVTGSTTTSVGLLNSDGATIDPRDRNWTITETVPISSANTLDVKQVSGANWSVIATATDLDIRDLANASDSVSVYQVSGHNWSVYAQDALTTVTATTLVNADNRIRVSLETGGSGLTDSELRATAVPVSQVSGARWSTEATQGTSPWVVSATDLDVRDLNVAQDEILVHQISGANWSVSVVNTPAVTVSGSITSTVAVGPTVADAADDGNAPIQIGGIARTANPTAVAANDVVKSTHDDLGRQLVRPVQVRDLTITAYATFATGTEATLLAASAGSFHDLIYVLASNNSTAAVGIDIRPVTAGNIVMHLEIPANGVVGVAAPVPIPQSASDTGNNWTVDLPDITGTTVYVSALFSREI